jgi:Domain of unknown function DUF29
MATAFLPNRDPQRGPDQDEDLAAWAFHQAMLLRASQWQQLDAVLIAEELEDVGHEQYDKLESALRLILMHLLKWEYQPNRRSRSWTVTIATQRIVLERQLEKNPSLKARLQEALSAGYRRARLEAYAETELPLKTFPEICPYSLSDVRERPIEMPDE